MHALSGDNVGELLRALGIADDEALRAWLFAETRGQPFYLAETLDVLVERKVIVPHPDVDGGWMLADSGDGLSGRAALRSFIPAGVRDVLRARLALLTPTAFDLLAAGAVLGQDFAFEMLCRVAEVPPGNGLTILDELLASRLLVEDRIDAASGARPYTFSHDKVRDVVYTEAGDARRRLFHERALQALAKSDAPPAQLAHHARNAGKQEKFVRFSLQAGEAAMRLFAVQEAVLHLEHAQRALAEDGGSDIELSAEERRRLYKLLGRAHELTNTWDAALAVYDEMLREARKRKLPRMEVAALNLLATVEMTGRMNISGAKPLLEEARRVAQKSDDAFGLAVTEWNLCMNHFYGFQREQALVHGERAVALAREVEDADLVAKSLNGAADAATGLNQWDKVAAYANESYRIFAGLGNRAMEVDSQILVAGVHINSGRPHDGIEIIRRSHAVSREIDNVWEQANCENHLVVALLETGAYGEAHSIALQTLERVRDVVPLLHMAALSVRASVHQAFQSPEAALKAHQKTLKYMDTLPNPGFRRAISPHLCADYAMLGDWDKAYEQARLAKDSKDFSWYYSGFRYWSVTEALLRGGDEKVAAADVTNLEAAVAIYPRYQIVVARCKAVLAEALEDSVAAIGHLEEALTKSQALQLPGEQWPILNELARLNQDRGDTDAARNATDLARSIVHELAATLDDHKVRESFLKNSGMAD